MIPKYWFHWYKSSFHLHHLIQNHLFMMLKIPILYH